VLQKISDPRLTQCPECGQDTFSKQVTAAGFQLKGSGWYVTDFRDGGRKSGTDAASTSSTASSSTTAASAPATPAATDSGSSAAGASAPAAT
jgi:predicted nucleic acid-binding Zn ribbon protein